MLEHEDTLDGAVDVIDNKLEYFSFFPIRFICYVIAFASVYLIVMGIIAMSLNAVVIGIIFLTITLPIAIVQKRMMVDLTGNRYREYLSWGGFKTGKWHSFKGFKTITITHSDKLVSMNARYGGAQAYSKSTEFYLNLKKDNYNKLNIASGDYENIFKKAITLSHRFKADILDCSEKPNKKIEYAVIAEKYPDTSL